MLPPVSARSAVVTILIPRRPGRVPHSATDWIGDRARFVWRRRVRSCGRGRGGGRRGAPHVSLYLVVVDAMTMCKRSRDGVCMFYRILVILQVIRHFN